MLDDVFPSCDPARTRSARRVGADMSDKTIAVIGLGNMGGAMAANLVKAGYEVLGFDPVPAAQARARENGIEVTADGPAAAARADIILTMLPNATYVREAWAALLPAAKPGALIADSSTVDVETARALHAMAAEAGLQSVDAPVSGGVAGAQAAKLTFMLGGADEAAERIAPVLAALGQKTVRCGDAGAGQAAKICNNMILGVNIVAVSEAFALAEKLGLSAQAMFDVASGSTGQCWALTSYCPVPGIVPTAPSNNDYKPGAAATMLLKDLLLAQEAAGSVAANTPLGTHVTEIYEKFVADGHGDEDFSAIIKSLR
ncbi:3-hydroxyisobutyrate dehydrogenase [Pseudooceanicola sp. CBS1P-1]|uniref:3-hydroxyisobutyrate dehydrogenase n=1 Tax=Pseudooceanicola albus TaxID=2692189 RepID=A0A6L7G830_9RHOB|nr:MULTISPECIES: 3-hydroxyisobutyrate dehydrogenase [Pseudooceanicola]MBT9386458.1 3-hydroxyisobutyrate dehydrogenase [Pseudooceanicola endophyticus]MXN20384.1 3-hydroxyisobutyrate dehydrogenase [Pseudooceanicola albus]